jgi:RNA polymerase sigma-70 factor (ECF subfamily)
VTPFSPIFPHVCTQQSRARMPNLLANHVLFPFVGRKNMPDADAPTQTAQYPDVADEQSGAHELQRVLSLSLPTFYRCALRLLGNSADAEDAVQEALLAAHKHLHQFRGQSQMSTWLTTIVCNCARMQLRKRPRLIHMPLDEQFGEDEGYFISERLADTRPSPEDECRKSELAAHLGKCTALLSPSLRRTFQLRIADGLSIFETAQVLGVPQGTVKTRLARARTNLARHMQRALEPRSHTPQRAYRTSRRRKMISRVD